MPKLEIPKNAQNDPEVDVIAEELTEALARLDWLLQGNIDADNIAQKVRGNAEQKFMLPASKVQDIPLISNEINANKFVRDEFGENTFNILLWNPLKEKALANPIFSVFSADLFVPLTKDNKAYTASVIQQNLTYSFDHFKGDYEAITNIVLSKFNNTIYVKLPSTYTPVNYKRLLEQYGFDSDYISDISNDEIKETDIVINYEIYMDCYGIKTGGKKKQWFTLPKPSSAVYDPISQTVSVDIAPTVANLADVVFEEEDFLNISIKMSVLCEERI